MAQLYVMALGWAMLPCYTFDTITPLQWNNRSMQMWKGSARGLFTLVWMHSALVLAGMGTVLLGPVLPLLSRRWHLDDSQSGLLLLAQFFGAFLGGISIRSRPRREVMTGILAAIAGLMGFAAASKVGYACVAIAIMGFGIGRLITCANLLIAWQFPDNRRSMLTKLSFYWGIGAMLSPVLSALLAPRHSLQAIWIGFAAVFAILLVPLLGGTVQIPIRAPICSDAEGGSPGLQPRTMILFAVSFALYGGLESSLSGWMSTFAVRFGGFLITTSEYTSFLLLAGLTAGRLLAGFLPAKRSDKGVLQATLATSILCILLLASTSSRFTISVFATLLGISLAAVFPTLLSLLMAQGPQPRQAGLVNALAGLGGAIVPWSVGLVSKWTGSLKMALVIPLASAILLLWMTFLREQKLSSA